jgi:hypothetical protein
MAYVMVKTNHGVVIYVVMTVMVATVMIQANVLIVAAVEAATVKLLLSTNSHMIGIVQVLQEPAH